MRRPLAVLAIASALAACTTVPMGDPRRDAALKAFEAAPGMGGLYVHRGPPGRVGATMHVDVDGTPLGRTMPGTYLYRDVAPGRHVVAAHAENSVELDVDVGPGELVFVRQDTAWGLFAPRTRLHLEEPSRGREAVLASRLAESHAPVQAIEVRVEADDPAWRGPLACRAANGFGSWTFEAPGTVVVAASGTPLRFECALPVADPDLAGDAGPLVVTTATAVPAASPTGGSQSGAAIGAVAGVVIGAASVPVMGPAFAILLAAGSAIRGAEIGALTGASPARAGPAYPSPVVVRIARGAPAR